MIFSFGILYGFVGCDEGTLVSPLQIEHPYINVDERIRHSVTRLFFRDLAEKGCLIPGVFYFTQHFFGFWTLKLTDDHDD